MRTRLSAAVLAMLALLLATLARVTPVALDPMDETDWLSSSASRSANTLSDGALCRFSFKMRSFHPWAVCALYMLYWRPLIAARAGAGTSALESGPTHVTVGVGGRRGRTPSFHIFKKV